MKTRARMAGVVDVKRVTEIAGTAALEVSKSVRMRGVEAPDVDKSYVARSASNEVDADGLPLVYNKDAIQKYWDKQGGALQRRWAEFLSLSVPFLTKVATLAITGGSAELSKNDRALAKDARIIIEKLGPTYIKAGQMMSVRPDVLPQAALDELAVLQDSVKPFETATRSKPSKRSSVAPSANSLTKSVKFPSLRRRSRKFTAPSSRVRMSTSRSRCSDRKFSTPCPRICTFFGGRQKCTKA